MLQSRNIHASYQLSMNFEFTLLTLLDPHSVNALFFIFRYRMLKVRQLQHLTSLSENRG